MAVSRSGDFGHLPEGRWRALTPGEREALLKASAG